MSEMREDPPIVVVGVCISELFRDSNRDLSEQYA